MKRIEINEGAQAPAVGASGTVTVRDWRDAGRQQTGSGAITISPDATAARNGELLVARICEWVKELRRKSTEEHAVRELRRLLQAFPELVAVPELLEFLVELFAKNRREAIAHILGGVGRGRRREQVGPIVALVDLVMQQEGCNVASACKKLRDLPNSPFRHLTVERMRNIYSEHGEVVHALRNFYVTERDLARVPRDMLDDIFGTLWRQRACR